MSHVPKPSYDYDDLITSSRGELFGPGNAQLPAPPMLMFDRITTINDNGGAEVCAGEALNAARILLSDMESRSHKFTPSDNTAWTGR